MKPINIDYVCVFIPKFWVNVLRTFVVLILITLNQLFINRPTGQIIFGAGVWGGGERWGEGLVLHPKERSKTAL